MTIEDTIPNVEECTRQMESKGLVFLARRVLTPDKQTPLAQLTAKLYNRGIQSTSRIVWDCETIGLAQTFQAVYVPQEKFAVAIRVQQDYIASQPGF